jgi:hypothetical protein
MLHNLSYQGSLKHYSLDNRCFPVSAIYLVGRMVWDRPSLKDCTSYLTIAPYRGPNRCGNVAHVVKLTPYQSPYRTNFDLLAGFPTENEIMIFR